MTVMAVFSVMIVITCSDGSIFSDASVSSDDSDASVSSDGSVSSNNSDYSDENVFSDASVCSDDSDASVSSDGSDDSDASVSSQEKLYSHKPYDKHLYTIKCKYITLCQHSWLKNIIKIHGENVCIFCSPFLLLAIGDVKVHISRHTGKVLLNTFEGRGLRPISKL